MRKPTKFGIKAIAAILIPSICQAADYNIPVGRYSIDSQMVLPHMEEMRRIHKQVDTCIGDGDVARLFPIFHQPALTGCALSLARSDDETAHYRLECSGVNGASGNASLNLNGANIRGALVAKIGGKNMTFSQFVSAQRLGACSPAEYLP